MSGKVIKVGLVGTGFIATEVHLPVLLKLGDAKVTAICDKDEKSLQEAAKRFKIPKAYCELTEMVQREELDLIDICTPPDTHAALTIRTLESGCNCLVEKPLAMSTNDADRMIGVAKKQGLFLNVIHNYSFMSCIRKARSMVAAGDIGEVTGVEVKYLTSLEKERYFAPNHWCHHLPGGILGTEIMSHLIMLLLDFMGGVELLHVATGKFSKYSYIPADELRIIAKGSNSLGSLTLSFNAPLLRLSIDLVGTKGCLYIDANSQTVVRYKARNCKDGIDHNRDVIGRGSAALGDIAQRLVGLSSAAINVIFGKYQPGTEGHKYLIKTCLRSLRGEGQYPIDIWKCREVVRISEEVSNLIP